MTQPQQQQQHRNVGGGHFVPVQSGQVREDTDRNLESEDMRPTLERQQTQRAVESSDTQPNIDHPGQGSVING